jgi:hypothetical protein
MDGPDLAIILRKCCEVLFLCHPGDDHCDLYIEKKKSYFSDLRWRFWRCRVLMIGGFGASSICEFGLKASAVQVVLIGVG